MEARDLTEEIIPGVEVVSDNGLTGRLAVEHREVGGSDKY